MALTRRRLLHGEPAKQRADLRPPWTVDAALFSEGRTLHYARAVSSLLSAPCHPLETVCSTA